MCLQIEREFEKFCNVVAKVSLLYLTCKLPASVEKNIEVLKAQSFLTKKPL
jgi:hypothetical protein